MPAQYKFNLIHVIESVKESDGEPGRVIADNWNASALSGPRMRYHFVFNRTDLLRVLDEIHSEIPQWNPLLHFEVHGNDNGIELRDGSFVPWTEMGPWLWRINLATRFNLIAVFSCCFGIHQINAMTAFEPAPLACVVGCDRETKTMEMLQGFEAFYRTLFATANIESAMTDLQRHIKSDARFAFLTAEKMFRGSYKEAMELSRSKAYFAERTKRIRNEIAQSAKANRQANPKISSAQIKRVLMQTEPEILQKFYSIFFGCELIPENRQRFPFDQLTAE